MADAPRRPRPLVAEPRPGATDLLERESLPDPDDRSLPDPGRAERHLPPDAARRAFSRPPSVSKVGPPTLTDRLEHARRSAGRVPTRQLTTAVVVTLAGVALLLGWVVHVSWTPLLDVGLVVLGVLLVVQARRGSVSRPLIALGVLIALVAAATWRANVTLDGGFGRRTVVPVASTTIDRKLGTGQLTIDLREVAAGDRPIDVRAEVGIGRIVVKVPKSMSIRTRAVAGAGASIVLSKDHVGPGVDETSTSTKKGGRVVVLDLHVGVGTVEVRRV